MCSRGDDGERAWVCAPYSSYCTKMARSRREAEEGEAALVREIRDIKNEST